MTELFLCIEILVKSPSRQASKTNRVTFLTALTLCVAMMISIAIKLVELQRDITWVDVSALAIVAIMTGIFLTLFLQPARPFE